MNPALPHVVPTPTLNLVIRKFGLQTSANVRAVAISWDRLQALGYDQIDNLAAMGRITEPLKEMAHKLRLTANEELYGKPDDLDTFTERKPKES